MSEKISARRCIVCVDGVTGATNTTSGASHIRNVSSISRLTSAIKTGQFVDDNGRIIVQHVQYYQAIIPGSALAAKFRSKTIPPAEQQIQDIVLGIFQKLENPSDEIFLFGSGCGAHTVRAVAGVLHHMGIPKPGYLGDFPELYRNASELIRARQQDDSQRGHKALMYLRVRSDGMPNIKFVGIFDAVKPPADKQLHDTSVVSSVRNFRHALAFNENRSTNALDVPETPAAKDMEGRSFIQAWFLGYHSDLIGGTQQDGLSLYPLQWILIEAMLSGLTVSPDVTGKETAPMENPLSLIFPQYAGGVPDLSGSEKIQWQIQYVNNIQVNMFDLQSMHVAKNNTEDASHTIHFETVSSFHNAPRKIFNKEALIGWNKEQHLGTIIHPSVFCILDRNQSYLQQNRFKPYKEMLADFELNCMRGHAEEMPPWMQDSELLASGVKAFRILVCGKTGVGKSTLINKVFGVEMTEESNTYAQGNHDINQAFESPNHPGLLIHDSRGWQAGSDKELELIAQFLRHRAFQKDPAEALHVIWFCVDSDVSRIEEADKRTFATIAQFSNNVPVFVIGTKKDKLIAFRKMLLLEQYMEKTNDYQESNRLANLEADKLAQEQFNALRDQLSQIKSYKADGYVCISKNDDAGVKTLLTQTLDMIVDERVRLFCVAAQVVDVEQKIDSAITECMRLGTHAIRTAMVPLPFSGIVGTPTVCRIICEHVLQCFGFPKAMPEEVEDIMSRIVLGNLKQFMTVSLTQFMIISGASVGLMVGTMGVGALLGLASCFLATPPTARMLLKCSCDMILILERSFRYSGKYVSTKQIDDAAKQYVTINTTTFGGKEKRLQEHVHEEVDKMIPLTKIATGFRFSKLRTGFEHIVYKNRYDRPPEYNEEDPFADKMVELDGGTIFSPVELSPDGERRAELPGMTAIAELPSTQPAAYPIGVMELPGSTPSETTLVSRSQPQEQRQSELSTISSPTMTASSPAVTVSSPAMTSRTFSTPLTATTMTELSASPSIKENKLEKTKSEGSNFFSRGWKSMKKTKSKTTT